MFQQVLENESKLFSHYKQPIVGEKLTTFSGLQRLIMLDRYAQKDLTLQTLKKGDVVVVTLEHHPKYPKIGYGTVKEVNSDRTAVLNVEYPEAISTGEDISNLTRSFSDINKPVEIFWEQIAHRVAVAMAEVEDWESRDYWYNKFYWMISNQLLIPGGRINYGAGNGKDVTLYNCYVLPPVEDSRTGIAEHAKLIIETMARGGGCGTNISTLRPSKSIVEGINGFSSGSIAWANWFSSLTPLIQQGGTRNGAQMIAQYDWHPDIIEFAICKIQNPYVLDKISKEIDDQYIRAIVEKYLVRDHEGKPSGVRDTNFMTGANISVLVTNDFMEAVKAGKEWKLRFPNMTAFSPEQKRIYDEQWHNIGDVREWEKRGLPVKTYHTINAADFWHMLMVCARYSAEPGVIFIDFYNEESNSWYYNPLICTNPCGEQGLPAWGVCNLSAINLAEMYNPATNDVDWEKLRDVTYFSQRFCDNVTDANKYFFEDNEIQAKGERRIGKGFLGLADLMIKMKLPYGSERMIKKTEEISFFLAKHSYLAAADIAEEKGSFGHFDYDKFMQSGFMKRMAEHAPEVAEAIKEKGCRNVTSITMAPTGSIGTMIGVATGIEPYFAFEYYRTSRFGAFTKVNTPIAQDYFDANPEATELPGYYISAMQLAPEDHVLVQAALQKWVDSSISKTVNAPKHFTVEDTKKIYTMAHSHGCKGVTIYVDGSRSEQVLSLEAKDNVLEDVEDEKEEVKAQEQPAASNEELDTESTKVCKISYDTSGNRVVECS